jgi:hypothetical protein
MNALLLMAGLRVWSGGPLEALTRIFLTISLVSLEIQAITWAGVGTFRTLILPNVAIAAILLGGRRARVTPLRTSKPTKVTGATSCRRRSPWRSWCCSSITSCR